MVEWLQPRVPAWNGFNSLLVRQACTSYTLDMLFLLLLGHKSAQIGSATGNYAVSFGERLARRTEKNMIFCLISQPIGAWADRV